MSAMFVVILAVFAAIFVEFVVILDVFDVTLVSNAVMFALFALILLDKVTVSLKLKIVFARNG